ncbi:MAG: lysylphosphatidylglycerol synthase domain-containing protein [Fulvivirga sp.]|nr:lysylphosphatidylglycerol synthase domain-containing protein [Fulvivirga sp.]
MKFFILLLIGLFIYYKLKDEKIIGAELVALFANAFKNQKVWLIVVVLLMPLNWWLESLKWKRLARPVVNLPLKAAINGVLAGLSLAFITPHGLGDYVGRVFSFEHDQREKLLGGIFLGRMFQLLATLLFGTYGVYFLLGMSWTSVYVIIILCLVFTGLAIGWWSRKVKHPFLLRIGYYTNIIRTYRSFDLVYIFLLSCFRYTVFCFQFVVVLLMFTDLPILLNMAGATWVLMAKSIIPTFNFLSDLGVREFSAIYFFETFEIQLMPVLSASLFIWFINILVPTVIGATQVIKLKISS